MTQIDTAILELALQAELEHYDSIHTCMEDIATSTYIGYNARVVYDMTPAQAHKYGVLIDGMDTNPKAYAMWLSKVQQHKDDIRNKAWDVFKKAA